MNSMDARLLDLDDGAEVEVSNAKRIRCLSTTDYQCHSIRCAAALFGDMEWGVNVTVNRLTFGGTTDLGQGTAFYNYMVAVRGIMEPS